MAHNSMFNITLNQILNVHFSTTNNLVVEASTTFSSFILISLLLVTLVLTFHAKGTTVHKVLGLLLTSIFAVFLWILQSQFLFIYVVYILAFISAVLMLFLSVVLMLPISTLTAKNTLTDQKNKHKAYFFAIVVSQDWFTVSAISIMMATVLILVIFFSKSARHYTIIKLYNDLIEYSKHHFSIFNQISVNNFFNKAKNQMKLNTPLNKHSATLTNALHKSAWQLGNAGWKTALNFKQENTRISNIKNAAVLWLTLSLTITELTLLFLRNLFFVTIVALKYNIHVVIQAFKIIHNVPADAAKVFWDITVQTYLFATVLLSMVSLFLSNQILLQVTTSALNNDLAQGLGQIKELLYGDFSLFLLLSTLVLLVALLGAAVMTRSKR